ncbi:hypothetical protein [Alkalilimnicola sp. S0819]|uniref:hypothetical protein n=1 Tax=Alkalilimnicola sp. S0819 TaxID=2613922 RepID=UPI001261568B|nr:hypothetical protein [Alkalilimnicola sp. S0819]KAB7623181.1 hypothetical protein F3N43_10310 [Alkalilimnicola sp. S0819]MPQ17026.1 hypothetical protein [Alkalilimnicola sp. S0819]
MSLPAYLAGVDADRLRLAGDTRDLRAQLRQSRWAEQVFRDAGMALCIGIPPGANPLVEPAVIELLEWLRVQGVVFVEDYTVPYGPGQIMRALLADGEVGPFQSLIIRSEQDWELEEHRGPPGP